MSRRCWPATLARWDAERSRALADRQADRHRPPRRRRDSGGGSGLRDRGRPRGRRDHIHDAWRREGDRAPAQRPPGHPGRRGHRPHPGRAPGSRWGGGPVPGRARPEPDAARIGSAARAGDAAGCLHGFGDRPRAAAGRRGPQALSGRAERARVSRGDAAALSRRAPGPDRRRLCSERERLPEGGCRRARHGIVAVSGAPHQSRGSGRGDAPGEAGAGRRQAGRLKKEKTMRTHDDLAYMPATELAARIRERDLSPVEAVDAGAAPGALHGVPIAINDLFDFKAGVPNTFGCKPFKDWTPTVSATYVTRLEQAGAIVLGKTNTPEFGHRGITDNYLFGPTSTPFQIGKNAGGSSGGSAAAVADGLAAIAQGSDGGGSIRIPAAWCGVYGFKASFGRVAAVARPDAFMLAVPFAHAGPLARSVADAALMLGGMSGPDGRDPYSLPADGADYMAATKRSIAGMRIAWSPDLGVFPIDPEVARVTREAVAAFEVAGAHVDEVRVGLRRTQEELCDCWMRQSAVRSAQTADGFKDHGIDLLGSHRGDILPEFAAGLELGHTQSALDYRRDDVIRTEVLDALQDVFDRYDLLVCPTLAAMPVDNAKDGNTLGPSDIGGRRVDPLLGWCLTYPFNFTGHPVASIPASLE